MPAPPEEILTGPRTTFPSLISQAFCDSRSTHDRALVEHGVPSTSGWLWAATAAGAVARLGDGTSREQAADAATIPTSTATVFVRCPPLLNMISVALMDGARTVVHSIWSNAPSAPRMRRSPEMRRRPPRPRYANEMAAVAGRAQPVEVSSVPRTPDR